MIQLDILRLKAELAQAQASLASAGALGPGAPAAMAVIQAKITAITAQLTFKNA